MKFILNSTDISDDKSVESVSEDELNYLLQKENKILNAREIFIWDQSLPKTKTYSRKKYCTALALGIYSQQPLSELSVDSLKTVINKEIYTEYRDQKLELGKLPGFIDISRETIGGQKQTLPDQEGEAGQSRCKPCNYTVDIEYEEYIGGESWLGENSSEEEIIVFELNGFTDYADTDEEEVDWLGLAGEADDFEDDLALHFTEVDTEGVISLEERALQVAMGLGSQHDLTAEEVEAVAGIFIENGWSACREAINRELNDGTTITEIKLAAAIKEIWVEHCEFYSGQQSNYRILSWPTALKFANSFRGYPEPVEVEILLIRLHQHWRTDNIQRRIFLTFNEYLIDYLTRIEDDFEYSQEWCVSQEQDFRDDIFLPPSSSDLPHYHDYDFDRSLRIIRLAYFYES